VSPDQVSASTVKKSHAAMAGQWARRNAFHVVRLKRSGAGSMPCSFRMDRMVVRASS
jgi:hypothetical protein